MSFSPLPKILIADLERDAAGPVVDLGCGDGVFTERLRAHAGAVLGLDRDRAGHVRAAATADLRRPPLRRGGCGVLVAANLLRHLPEPRAAVDAWREALRPDGRLWILEDEPAAGDGPGALYRDLQAYLQRRDPLRRGPLMAREQMESFVTGEAGWSWGSFRNREPLRDPAPLKIALATAAVGGDTAAAGLLERLEHEPFTYGDAWWARWSREDAC